MMNYIKYGVLIGGILFLLIGCGFESTQNQPELEFSVTPEPGGAPVFSQPENNDESIVSEEYPAPMDELSGYPAPANNAPNNESGYPAPTNAHSQDGRSLTALQSYELAYPVALSEFSPDAYLAEIIPSHIMLRNLGNPPVLPGWFFKFKKPDSRREFIVQVVDEVITGTTLTESAMDVTSPSRPIDVSQIVLDSPDVLDKFKEVGSARGVWSESVAYDLALVYLEGTNGPVWGVVDPITFEWLFSVDAITGEEVESPYQ